MPAFPAFILLWILLPCSLYAEEPQISLADDSRQEEKDYSRQYQGIVKIEVDALMPDYTMPWQSGKYISGIGTGFLIGPNRFLTNAHVTANAERIYLSMYGDPRKIPAKVKFIAHDADLAIVEADDFAPFEGIEPFAISDELPQLEDEVKAIGYPVGGSRLSVTRGVVSRIDFNVYSHPRAVQHLTVQIDAAINPGNSGGPVIMDGKVIGVAFQGLKEADNTGYVIPSPVVKRFLKDVEDGTYDSYVELSIYDFPLTNPAMRTALGLPDNNLGVLVSQVNKGGSCDGVLQNGDVILAIDGRQVDSSGMVLLDGEKIRLDELCERLFVGDSIRLDILRARAPMAVSIALKDAPGLKILMAEFDKQPRYVISGGIVFQPLQRNVLTAHKIGGTTINMAIRDFSELGDCLEKEDIVIITQYLSDQVNAEMPDVSGSIVSKINGIPVKGLKHLYQLIYEENKDPYIVIELKDEKRPLVLDAATLREADARIARQYNIPFPHRLQDTL